MASSANITLHVNPLPPPPAFSSASPLPTLLQTPAGLALMELQGRINVPEAYDPDAIAAAAAANHSMAGGDGNGEVEETGRLDPLHVGRLDFPDYRPGQDGSDGGTGVGAAWMKRVYMWVGAHQRLTGEVKKLPRALAVVRRREPQRQAKGPGMEGQGGGGGEEEGKMDVMDEGNGGGDGRGKGAAGKEEGDGEEGGEVLEVVELVKYKIVFSQRPEPVSKSTSGIGRGP